MANNWRKEAVKNIERLNSLLFGADLALVRGDPCSFQSLFSHLFLYLYNRKNYGFLEFLMHVVLISFHFFIMLF